MSPRPDLRPPYEGSAPDFGSLAAAMAGTPLHEVGPAGPGADAAALGFSLGIAVAWAGRPGIIWAGEEMAFAEEGAPCPTGLAEFGLDPGRLIVVKAKKRDEALWAAEQGLAAAGAVVICSLGPGKPLDLKATRRLLLIAERNHARCLLLKPEDGPTAAWTRWRVAPGASRGIGRELGRPVFRAELTRHRGGVAGARFDLEWNAHDRAFAECGALAGDLAAAPGYRPAEAQRRRAV